VLRTAQVLLMLHCSVFCYKHDDQNNNNNLSSRSVYLPWRILCVCIIIRFHIFLKFLSVLFSFMPLYGALVFSYAFSLLFLSLFFFSMLMLSLSFSCQIFFSYSAFVSFLLFTSQAHNSPTTGMCAVPLLDVMLLCFP
jgi:hypothetical protein